jgi:hypothetical protein
MAAVQVFLAGADRPGEPSGKVGARVENPAETAWMGFEVALGRFRRCRSPRRLPTWWLRSA